MTNMSTEDLPSTSLLSQINSDYLTCQICIDSFTRPKVLGCQHTFCLSCLESCEASESGSYISCPVCREKTLLGMKGVAGLRDNFVLSNMIEMLQTWDQSKRKEKISVDTKEITKCNSCDSDNQLEATLKCLDCLDNFCMDCAAFHQRTKLTKHHEVVVIEEIENGIHDEKIRLRERSRCKEHEIQMKHYCRDCNTPVCKDCIVEKHHSHDLGLIEDAEEEKREQVSTMKINLESGMDRLQKRIKETTDLRDKEVKQLKRNRDEIKKRVKELKRALKEKQSELLAEVEKVQKTNLQNIDGCINGLNTQLKCMENCMQLSSHLLKSNTPYEILAMHQTFNDTVIELDSKTEEEMTKTTQTLENLVKYKINFNPLDHMTKLLPNIVTENDATATKEVAKDVKITRSDSESTVRPKAAPRKLNTTEQEKKPEPATRFTQVITSKEIEKLNEITLNESTKQNSRAEELANTSTELSKAQSLVNLRTLEQPSTPKPVLRSASPKPVMGNQKKAKAPKPPTHLPPPPPPQSMKPSLIQSKPFPLRGILYTKLGKKGKVLTNGEFIGPPNCVISSKLKNKVYALDAESRRVLIFSGDGIFKKSFKVAVQKNIRPVSIAEFGKTHLLVLYRRMITEWVWDGRMIKKWGESDLINANCITTDSEGKIIVSDQEKSMIFIYDSSTKNKIMQLGGFGDRDDLFKSPRHICINEANDIIVSDRHNHCIKVFNKSGKFLFKCGGKGSYDGELKYPEGIATVKLADGKDGIVIADEGNCRISLFTHEGKFLGHILTKADDKNLKSPQNISVSNTGEELVIRQANQFGIRVYKLAKVGT